MCDSNSDTKELQPSLIPTGLVFNQNLWKLVKPKYVLQFYFCKECRDNLFRANDKLMRFENGVTIKFNLCEECVTKNCRATDIFK
ncbi:unnamed protein product [Meloidogyne enterolobii]|uniref:Uncharacterized protein n=2 Tax=Meloidogyne enterolobii TaxID=390850 RepID=A0A6V7W884_MELEN|nr:unnamed protein product [Meloidogyne enterolobii]